MDLDYLRKGLVCLKLIMYNTKKIKKRDCELQSFEKEFGELCSVINVLIGAETDVNYRILIPQVSFCKHEKDSFNVYQYKGVIEFNIELNTIERVSQTRNLRQKLKTITEFIQNIDWNEQQIEYQRLIAKIKLMLDLGFEFKANLICELPQLSLSYNEELVLNFDLKDSVPKIRQLIKKDHQHVIKNVCDRFISDYGLYINLSKPFSVFNQGYNYLHVYEHLMTYAWKGLPKHKMKLLNGFTTINGNCAIYVVLSSKEALEMYLTSYLKFCKDVITNKKWPGLECEMNRTISETLNEKTLTAFGRTDPSINLTGGMHNTTQKQLHKPIINMTGGDYNENIFNEFIIDTLNVLIIGPELVSIDTKLFNEVSDLIIKESKRKPKNEIETEFDYFPLSVCLDKKDRVYHILPKNLECKNKNKHGKGIDTQIYTDTSGLYSVYIDELMFSDDKQLRAYLNSHMLPKSNIDLI